MDLYCVSVACLCLVIARTGACLSVNGIAVTPPVDRVVSTSFLDNITYSCTVDGGRNAVWEVNERQYQDERDTVFNNIGVFIESFNDSTVDLIITQMARAAYGETGAVIMCTAFNAPTLDTSLGEPYFVVEYGVPEMPRSLTLVPQGLTLVLQWDRPTNTPQQVVLTYSITITSEAGRVIGPSNVTQTTQFSISEQILTDSTVCERFNFTVVAIAPDVPDTSEQAAIQDTVPVSTDVSSISRTLKVEEVNLMDGNVQNILISFLPVETCNVNFPVMNYTVVINDMETHTIPAVETNDRVRLSLTADETGQLTGGVAYRLSVTACSEVNCRQSASIPLNTTDVQLGSVVFFENNVYLICVLASNSVVRGCVFSFLGNQNQTETEDFYVVNTGVMSAQCNVTENQRNGYMEISVVDWKSDGSRGFVPFVLGNMDVNVLNTAENFTEQTGCTIQQSTPPSNNAVRIVVPIVVILVLIVIIIVIAIGIVMYIKLKRVKEKPRFKEATDSDELFIDIHSDNKELISTPKFGRRTSEPTGSVVTYKPVPLDAQKFQRSVSDTGAVNKISDMPAPIEVEVNCKTIRVKVNKPALRAATRRHSAARRTKSEGGSTTSDPEEFTRLLPSMSSEIKFSTEFQDMCRQLTPVAEEGLEDITEEKVSSPTGSEQGISFIAATQSLKST